MMNKKIVFLVVFIFAVSMTACGHQHSFTVATCTESATCTECGATEGEPLGHEWLEATCTEPKTCVRCGTTEGEPLGHEWLEANCTEPKTCIRCGITEGDILEHDWEYATIDKPKTCKNCGFTEGEPVHCEYNSFYKEIVQGEFDWDSVTSFPDTIICQRVRENDAITYTAFDYDGEIINTVSIPFTNEIWGYGTAFGSYNDDKLGFYISFTYKDNTIEEYLYDHNGEEITIHKNTSYTGNNEYIDAYVNFNICADTRYYAEVLQKGGKSIIGYYDTETNEFLSSEEKSFDLLADTETFEYDQDRFSYCVKMRGKAKEDIGGYFVSNADKSLWGYVDSDFNEIAMYEDATAFTRLGYALVSKDRKSYDIIDTDFNVVAKDYIQGDSAWASGGTMIGVNTENGEEYLLIY